jgi:hypothetical protein
MGSGYSVTGCQPGRVESISIFEPEVRSFLCEIEPFTMYYELRASPLLGNHRLRPSRSFKEGVGNAESTSVRSPGHLPAPAVEEKGTSGCALFFAQQITSK